MKNIILISLLLIHLIGFSQETTVTSKALNFSFSIPENFVVNEEFLSGAKETVLYSYAKGMKSDSSYEFIINIDNLEGILGKESKLSDNSNEGPHIEIIEWKNFELECVMLNVKDMFMCIIQVPLSPSAIQLNIGGPIDKIEEVVYLSLGLLESLEGNSNWK